VFVEGMKKWAKGGGPVPGETRRLFLVLTVGSTFSALVSWGFFLVDLPVAFGSQAVMAALLAALLVLGSGSEGSKRVSRYRYRRRLRRKRRTAGARR
jgi:hypothetical protein